ncbi:hypothetical protein C0J52_27761 [Blattella germanica]|nr:hypothetical protein C0J52_27761 [Blattella germanica]
MSVIAPSISATSSILKTQSIRLKTSQQHVRFKLPENVEEVLQKYTISKIIKPYEELILAVRDYEHIQDEQLLKLLKEVRGCVSYLDRNVHYFVDALLALNWAYRGDAVVTEFQEFLVDLLSAHNYYTKTVLENLLNRFKSGENEKEWTDGIPSKKEEVAYNHVHEVLKILLRVIPMSCDILVQSISKCFPFHGRPAHEQECYIHNILKITVYQPYLRYQILFFILKRYV